MKKYLLIFLATSTSIAFGQSRVICKSVEDDGVALSIRVNGKIDGQVIAYNETFDVSSLNRTERLALREKILDSLEIQSQPGIPKIPKAPRIPKAPVRQKQVAIEAETEMENGDNAVTFSGNDFKNQSLRGKEPFTKEIKYNTECGELFMRYTYVRNGEDYEYERTVNAKGKSEKERVKIIEETESELGLSTIQ